MKIWWVIAYDGYYPGSSLTNVHSTYKTEEEAKQQASKINDFDYVEVINVSPLLGIEQDYEDR